MGKKGWMMGLFIIVLAVFLLPGEPVLAQTDLQFGVITFEKRTARLDLDGDGREETLKVKAKYDSDDIYIVRLLLYVDGQKVYTIEDPNGWELGYNYRMDFIKMTDSRTYLRICTTGDNDGIYIEALYRYLPNKHTFKKEMDLLDDGVWGGSATVMEVTADSLTIEYGMQCMEVGWIRWTSEYVLKSGKLVLKKDTAKVKSTMGVPTDYTDPKYTRLYAKNKFKAKRKISFYTATEQGAVSFTVARKKTVKLQKIAYKNGKFYLQFSRGKKYGWIAIGEEYRELFYDVSHHLAG